MRLERLVEMIESVAPSYSTIMEPLHKRTRIPIQTSMKGFYPTAFRRKYLVGAFYEGVTRALYGGKLNDTKIDIEFENGEVANRSIKPDINDRINGLERESKASNYDTECKIMTRQLDGYKFLQYSNPELQYLFSFFRYSLSGIEKQERTEEEVLKMLLGQTLYLVNLPFSVVQKIDQTPRVGDRKISRRHIQKEGTKYPDCLCINPHTLNGFLLEPEKTLDILGLDADRFEVQRRYYSGTITINRRRFKPFPILTIIDRKYAEWVEEFRFSYEQEMSKPIETGDVISEIPLIGEQEQKQTLELPFD